MSQLTFQRLPYPRGRTLGGTSAINGMMYIRGNRRDYDGWAALGNTGWDYESVLPYFKKSENYDGPEFTFTCKFYLLLEIFLK